jgi:hypothetical protein
VDAAGFRNAWPWPEHPHIVAVGDSVTFGYGAKAEESWPAIVAQGLRQHPLVNLALIGAGPQQYLRVYETFGAALRPKLLLVGVFAANDFWDAETFDLWLKSGAGGNYIVWRDFGRPGPLRLSLRDPAGSIRSTFDRYVYPALRAARTYTLLRTIRDGLGADLAATPVYYEFAGGGRVLLSPGDLEDKSALGANTAPSFRLALDAFERLNTTARERGARVLFVLQPSKGEVYLPLLQANVPDPSSALRAAFDERGIEYLDLGPAFRERGAAGEQLFFEEDGHPNPAGYALTARLVLSHVSVGAERYGLTASSPAPVSPALPPTGSTQTDGTR